MNAKKKASKVSVKKPVKKPAVKPAAKVVKKTAKVTKKAVAIKAPVKSKTKPVVKTVKKLAKPLKVVAKKAVAKAPSKQKITAKTAPIQAKKTTTASVFSLKKAAHQLKRMIAGAPTKVAKPTQTAKKAILTDITSPKGLLTEERIRKMSDKDYMNDAQLSFFRYRLLQMRSEVLAREVDVKERLHQREVFADPADRATAEEEHWLDLRLRERESLLLRKIDDALRRIADREFGYCEKTGDAIGIPRLLARPTATVCVDVKGQDERIESQFRDR